MSRLIVVCGPSGAGKTTLATALSTALNTVCLHKDSIKAAVSDAAGVETSRSFEIFRSLVEEQLAARVDLIAEATFGFPGDGDVVRDWVARFDPALMVVVCQVEEAERRRRIAARPRHPVHAAADARAAPPFDAARLPGPQILVDTGRPLQECVDAVLRG